MVVELISLRRQNLFSPFLFLHFTLTGLYASRTIDKRDKDYLLKVQFLLGIRVSKPHMLCMYMRLFFASGGKDYNK